MAVRLLTVAVTAQMPPLNPLPGTGRLSPPDNPAVFRFLVAGDNRPPTATAAQPVTVTNVFQAASNLAASFVLWSGDTIYGRTTNPATLSKEYGAFLAAAQLAHAPVFNTPGNHEIDILVTNWSPNVMVQIGSPILADIYRTNMGVPEKAPLYGAFDYGNSRFIGLDTEEVFPPGAKDNCLPSTALPSLILLDPGYLSTNQLNALAQDLEQNRQKAHIFIIMHHPVYTQLDYARLAPTPPPLSPTSSPDTPTFRLSWLATSTFSTTRRNPPMSPRFPSALILRLFPPTTSFPVARAHL